MTQIMTEVALRVCEEYVASDQSDLGVRRWRLPEAQFIHAMIRPKEQSE